MKTILFVCSGNTCRSPMAEGYCNSLIERHQLTDKLRATSAGLHAFEGSPANERSRIVCFGDKIDLSNHLSRPVKAELVDEAALILVMTREHKEEMLERFPQCADKVHTLKEFAGKPGDIHDPIGSGNQVYEETYREIKEAVDKTFEKIRLKEDSGKLAK